MSMTTPSFSESRYVPRSAEAKRQWDRQNTQEIDADHKKKNQLVNDVGDMLKLFMVQLKHQNPLKPFDPNDMMQQVAIFSQVEQQMGLREDYKAMRQYAKYQALAGMASFLGAEASINGTIKTLTEDAPAVTFVYRLDEPIYREHKLTIRDSNGKEIYHEWLKQPENPDEPVQDIGTHRFQWTGHDSSGKRVKPGEYTLSVGGLTYQVREDGTPNLDTGRTVSASGTVTAPIEAYDTTNDQSPKLKIAGEWINMDEITQVYRPTQSPAQAARQYQSASGTNAFSPPPKGFTLPNAATPYESQGMPSIKEQIEAQLGPDFLKMIEQQANAGV